VYKINLLKVLYKTLCEIRKMMKWTKRKGEFSLCEKGKFLVFIRAFIFYGQLALLNCSEKVIKKCVHSLFSSAKLKDFSLFEKIKDVSK